MARSLEVPMTRLLRLLSLLVFLALCATCNPNTIPGDDNGADLLGTTPDMHVTVTGDGFTGCGLRTCASAHATCGPIGDGCGGLLDCGTCTLPETCGGGGVHSVCGGDGGCLPRTCSSVGASCGPVTDGCGGLLQCGSCDGGQTC